MNLQNVTQNLRLREYYYMLTRHKLLFSLIAFLSFFTAVVTSFVLPKIYRAETVMMVQDEKVLSPLLLGLAISPSAAARLRTFREELLSWPRLTLLVEKLKLNKNTKDQLQYEHLIRDLRKNISLKLKDANIITVGFEGPNPRKAQDIVQTLSDIVVGGNLVSSKVDATSAISFIQDELDKYRKKLEGSENELRKFREVYSTTFPVATRMNETLVALKIELNSLLVENTEEHPRVKQTKELITNLEQQRDDAMKQARQEGVDIAPEEFAKLVTSVPRQEQQLARLQRDYEVNERIYSSLLSKLETAKISDTLEKSENGMKFQILEPARLPLEPVKPNKFLFALSGLIIGMGLGALLIYLLELSDTSIRNLDEARLLLELPIFGSIPPINPTELFIEHSLVKGAS